MDQKTVIAERNPLIGNPDLYILIRAHRIFLARYGQVQSKVILITADHFCSHAERFWYGSGRVLDTRDVELPALLVVGLHLGLLFDEIRKIIMESVSVVSVNCTFPYQSR